jgi:hypothetical protein
MSALCVRPAVDQPFPPGHVGRAEVVRATAELADRLTISRPLRLRFSQSIDGGVQGRQTIGSLRAAERHRLSGPMLSAYVAARDAPIHRVTCPFDYEQGTAPSRASGLESSGPVQDCGRQRKRRNVGSTMALERTRALSNAHVQDRPREGACLSRFLQPVAAADSATTRGAPDRSMGDRRQPGLRSLGVRQPRRVRADPGGGAARPQLSGRASPSPDVGSAPHEREEVFMASTVETAAGDARRPEQKI